MTTTQTPPTGTDLDAPIRETCGKCSGDGVVHYGNVTMNGVIRGQRDSGRICFDCGGSGETWTTQRKINRREKDRARRAAKAEEKRLAKLPEAEAKAAEEAAELAARMVAFTTAHPEVVKALPDITGDFGDSLRNQFEETGELTVNQVEAVRRITNERANDPNPAPVVEGRITVTGRIVSTKWVENDFGGSVKMLVLDDRGFKVWGTMPRSLEQTQYYDENGEYRVEAGAEKGDRVTFTGTVEASSDDETFGFYKRPTKAERLRVDTALPVV